MSKKTRIIVRIKKQQSGDPGVIDVIDVYNDTEENDDWLKSINGARESELRIHEELARRHQAEIAKQRPLHTPDIKRKPGGRLQPPSAMG